MPVARQRVQETEHGLHLVVARRGDLFLFAAPLVLTSDRWQLMNITLIFVEARRLGMLFDDLGDGGLALLSERVALFEGELGTPPGKAQALDQTRHAALRKPAPQPFSQMTPKQPTRPGRAFKARFERGRIQAFLGFE